MLYVILILILFDGTSIYVYTSGLVRKWIAIKSLCCDGPNKEVYIVNTTGCIH
jgi:hypothetical protein